MAGRRWPWRSRLVGLVCILLLVAGACAPAPASAPTKPEPAAPAAVAPATTRADSASGETAGGAPAGWEQTVAAAKSEGKLVLSGPPGPLWRDGLLTFEQDYPDIKIDFSGQNSRDFWPRLFQERAAGQYLWDLRV